MSITTNEVGVLDPVPGNYVLNEGELFTMTYAPATGYEFVDETKDGVREAEETTTIIPPKVQIADPAAVIGDDRYATFYDALKAVQNGQTIQLAKDSEETILAPGQSPDVNGKTFTIDLNGKKVSFVGGYTYAFTMTGSDITITDTSYGKNGALEKTTQSTIISVDKDSKLTLNYGAIRSVATSNPTGDVGAVVKVEGQFIMNGGEIEERMTGTTMFILSLRAGGSVSIAGGLLKGSVQDKTSGAVKLTFPTGSTARSELDLSEFCEAGVCMDDSQDGTATPYFVGAKIAITYDYGDGTAPEPANKAAFAAYTAARTFTLNQPTAPSGQKFKAWTTEATGVSFDGDAMTIAANFAETFEVKATYEADAPVWPDPSTVNDKSAEEVFGNAGIVLPDSLKGANAGLISAWATKNGVTFTPGSVIPEDAFLLDCAPAEVVAKKAEAAAQLTITSITYDTEKDEWVVLCAKGGDGDAFNTNANIGLKDVTGDFGDETEAGDVKGFFKLELVAKGPVKE